VTLCGFAPTSIEIQWGSIVDPTHFDHLTRAILSSDNRRALLARTATIGLAAVVTRLGIGSSQAQAAEEVSAERKKRKKRKCPKTRRCGKKRCCKKGQLCAGGVCVTGKGSCPAGTSTCEAGVPLLCSESCICVLTMEGATRCSQAGDNAPVGPCGGCTSDGDCAAFGTGAFCVAAGVGCGCQAGEGFCATPCLG
jgi:hypothetical protein